jgi:preprotein translocase subunit SecE
MQCGQGSIDNKAKIAYYDATSSQKAVLKNFSISMIQSIKNYFIGSYVEMKKVTWPTKQQTINYSLLVIGLSVGLAIFFAVLDFVFNTGITALIVRK